MEETDTKGSAEEWLGCFGERSILALGLIIDYSEACESQVRTISDSGICDPYTFDFRTLKLYTKVLDAVGPI